MFLAQFTCCIGFVSSSLLWVIVCFFCHSVWGIPLGSFCSWNIFFIFFKFAFSLKSFFLSLSPFLFNSIFSHFSLFTLLVSCDSFSSFVLLFTSFSHGAFSASFHNFPLYLHNLFLFLQLTVLFDCLSFCDFSHIRVFPFLLSLNSTSTQTGNALSWNKAISWHFHCFHSQLFKSKLCAFSIFISLPLSQTYSAPTSFIPVFSLCLYPYDHSSITRRTRMTWTNWEEGSAFSCTPKEMDYIHPMHLNLT